MLDLALNLRPSRTVHMNQTNRQARRRPRTSTLAAYLMPFLAFLIACGVCGGSDEDGNQACSAFKGNTEEGKFDVRTTGTGGMIERPNRLVLGVGYANEFYVHRNRVAKDDDRVHKLVSVSVEPTNIATAKIEEEGSGAFLLRGEEEGEGMLTISGLQNDQQATEVTDSIFIEVKKPTRAHLSVCRGNGVYVRGYPGPLKHKISSGYMELYGAPPFEPEVSPKKAGTVKLTAISGAYSTFSPSAKAPKKATISLGKELEHPGKLEVDIIDLEQIDELRLELVRSAATVRANETYSILLVAYSKGRVACTYGKALLTVKTPNICKLRYKGQTYQKLEMDGSVSSDLAVEMLAKGACSIAATLVIGELALELAEGAMDMEVGEAHVPSGGGSRSFGGWD